MLAFSVPIMLAVAMIASVLRTDAEGIATAAPAFAADGEGDGRSAAWPDPADPSRDYLEPSYRKYLADHGDDGTMASAEIQVDVSSFRTSDGMVAELEGGSVRTGDSGSITWRFTVREAGFYHIAVTYTPIRGTNAKIERKLYLDSEMGFAGMSQLVFHRKYDNSGGRPIAERNGNEILPEAAEILEPTTVYLADARRRNLEPYKFYLDEGEHTLTLESVKEPMRIHDITLKAAPAVRPYAEVIGEWKRRYKVYDGPNLVYQAERVEGGTLAVEKSSVDIVMSTDYSNPRTEPYHPYKIKLNTIGGTNWRTPGDYIQWRIQVPETALYRISFRAEQNTNRGVMSYRQLKVNGEVPFREALALPFRFHSGFVHYVPGTGEEAFLIPLKEGENTIALEVVLGDFAGPLSEVESSILALSELYRKTVQITGLVPDKYIDYEITKKIPGYAETLRAESERLKNVVEELVRITGEKGEKTALIEKMQLQAERLSAKPEDVIYEIGTWENNLSSMGVWITSISEMPLRMDSFTLSAPDARLPAAKPNVFVRAYYGLVRFLSTFFVDETETFGASGDNAIKVWIPTGRDQAQIIKNLIDQHFTPRTNIPVDLQLIPEDVIVPATLAGNGPDVALSLPQATVVNFAMRRALADLSQLDGFEEIRAHFPDSAIQTVSYQGGIYGLPEQMHFLMLFYREDILNQLGLAPPRTWDEVERMITILHAANHDFYIPGQELYPSLVYQYGADLYQGTGNDYGIRSGLIDERAMDAFNRLTRFFTAYRLPVTADFPNRFRTGEMPAGIASYTMFHQLSVFAPEIRGQWSFAPLPGVEQPDGRIRHDAAATTINSVIMNASERKREAWTFLRWWLDADTQARYAIALEAAMGAAARYPTANLDVMRQLPWSAKDMQPLIVQFENTVALREVPGGYMTARAIDYAFRTVVTGGAHPRETLYMNIRQIDKELTKKRKEFQLSHDDGVGPYAPTRNGERGGP